MRNYSFLGVIFFLPFLFSCSHSSVREISSSGSHQEQEKPQNLANNNTGMVDTKSFYEMLNDEKKHSQAMQQLLEEYKKNENDVDVLTLLAKFSLVSKNYPDALKYAQKAHDVSKGANYDVEFLLSVIYDNMGDSKSALQYLESSLKMNPQFKQAIDYKKIIEERGPVKTSDSQQGSGSQQQ